MANPTYLITGAYGFIGAWIVKRLLAEGAEIVVFDQSSDQRRWRLIMDDEETARPRCLAGDITDAAALLRAVEHHAITHIIHLAGLQVPICRADPRTGAMVNVVGTINVFDAALRSQGQVRKIVYASSAAVFGMTEDEHPLSEREAANPTTHYGAFKRCNEDNARVYYLDHGLSSIGLRPLTVYGVGRDFGLTSDPTKAMKAAVIGRPFHIRFGGRTDFLYVADTADAFIRASASGLTGSHVFNLHGETVSIAEIVGEIERAWPEARGLITQAETPLQIPPALDDTAIRAALGDLSITPLSQGVRETTARFDELNRAGRLDTADLDT
jgi:nucleoside-diphosphate-sugar epimerase